jgi:alpha-L-fucosidase
MKLKIHLVPLTVLAVALLPVRGQAAPSEPDAIHPETQQERDTRMAWWREAKFGMSIHWGLYSQLAGEWEGKPVGTC